MVSSNKLDADYIYRLVGNVRRQSSILDEQLVKTHKMKESLDEDIQRLVTYIIKEGVEKW